MMTHRILRASLVLLSASAATPASAQVVGVNAAVVNDVRVAMRADAAQRPAQVKERVALGNAIQTGRSSALQVLLLDRTNFQVGANARITIDKFVYDPNRSASAVGLSVAKGAFRFMSGKTLRASPGQSAIRTPVASIGIRGTIVEGVVGADAVSIAGAEAGVPTVAGADPATASLILLRGPGIGAQGQTPGAIDVTAGGRTVAVETIGFAVFVAGPNKPPVGPFLLSDSGLARLAALLSDPRRRRQASDSPLTQNPVVDFFFERSRSQSSDPSQPSQPTQPRI